MNFTTMDEAYFYFVSRVQQLAIDQGRDVIGWDEIWAAFGTKLNKSTIVHAWRSAQVCVDATKAGYRCLWSPYSAWYLDYLGVTWQAMYEQDPCAGIDDTTCKSLLLGGGGEQWGETADTSDVLQTIWPRMAAIAERLWSPKSINSSASATMRYAYHRCRLNSRGVAAAPYSNANARMQPSGPGGCLQQ